jgi:hypothetical protein
MRMPKLAIAVLLLALVVLASALSYTGFLVVGIVSEYLGTSRITTGLLIAAIFARLPSIRNEKLRTIGLLPRRARRPITIALLAFCWLITLYRGALVPALFLGFALAFLLTYGRLRKILVSRLISSFSKYPTETKRQHETDNTIIDVEVREKKK